MNVFETGTIRETAQKFPGLVTEYTLRAWVKEGRCPGFYRGNKFIVNQTALLDILEKETGNFDGD